MECSQLHLGDVASQRNVDLGRLVGVGKADSVTGGRQNVRVVLLEVPAVWCERMLLASTQHT